MPAIAVRKSLAYCSKKENESCGVDSDAEAETTYRDDDADATTKSSWWSGKTEAPTMTVWFQAAIDDPEDGALK